MKPKKIFLFSLALCIAFSFIVSGCSNSRNWVQRTIEKNYYRVDGDYSDLADLDGLSVEEMVSRLDKYSAFYTREQYAQVVSENEGNRSGIGITYVFEEGKGAVIYFVVGNSPAKNAGLKAGDVVVSALDGNGNLTEFNNSDDFSDFVSARAEGERFIFNLADGNTAELTKAQYKSSYVSMYTAEKSYDVEYDGEERIIVENDGGIPALPDGTAYFYMYQFFGDAFFEMADLIAKFNAEGYTSLILDLRDNGGGSVQIMTEIGGLFTAQYGGEHIAMKAVFKDGSQTVENCVEYAPGTAEYETKTVPAGTDVYVIANDNTASASEALIGVLVSYGILNYENIYLSAYEGETPKTYGKGIMQSIFPNYLTGEALKLTVAGIFWANGKSIHDKGLTVEDGCSVAPAGDRVVNVGYDDELEPVISKINNKAA